MSQEPQLENRFAQDKKKQNKTNKNVAFFFYFFFLPLSQLQMTKPPHILLFYSTHILYYTRCI